MSERARRSRAHKRKLRAQREHDKWLEGAVPTDQPGGHVQYSTAVPITRELLNDYTPLMLRRPERSKKLRAAIRDAIKTG